MTVILALMEVRKPHDYEKTRNSISVIQMRKASGEHVGGPLGVIISDGFGGFMTPG